ncbi:MAG: DUF2997 domain-containing protein [Methanolinea sp.]|nr:DUF2997 domain-containing protein [Methanolinea sp.]
MELQELEITVSRDGVVSVSVTGARGGECLSMTREIEERLGELRERDYKSEFYASREEVPIRESSRARAQDR